ncbi:MAG: NAD(P)/FAD-dependent oxidoreductase [Methylomicrobium sp.]
MNRRNFLSTMTVSGLGLLTLSAFPAFADDEFTGPRQFPVPTGTGIVGNILVVGGGMAGATVAKYLRLWGGQDVRVTLIEKSPSYTSNIMSNTVLTGQRTLDRLKYTYDVLTRHYGVDLLNEEVIEIGSDSIRLANGDIFLRGSDYDRLILAPGLEFDLLPGMTDLSEYETRIPHAWKAGEQTQLLRNQLLSLQPGHDVVITIPKMPYRCPPGPYERACVIADWLKVNKPGSQVIVLDANDDIVVEKDNFAHAFNTIHAGIVDYRAGCSITNVNSDELSIDYKQGSSTGFIKAGVLNPIPPQRAPHLLKAAGLLASDENPFAPVDVLSYESKQVPFIHVIGDACLSTMPKAGHIGNQQAKTCADAILRRLQGVEPDPAPVTNSACYTPITATTATWLSAVYQYNPTTGNMEIPSQHNPNPLTGKGSPIAATAATTGNYRDMLTWFETLMGDTYA